MPENKKCPFQRGEEGAFLDCFGEACMAHYEYKTFSCGSDPVPVPMCRLLDKPPASFPVPQFYPKPYNFVFGGDT